MRSGRSVSMMQGNNHPATERLTADEAGNRL